MRLTSRHVYYGMIGLIVILILGIIGGAYLANQQLQKQAVSLKSEKEQSQVFDSEQSSLAKAKRDVQTYSELRDIAKTIVPQDKDQAQAVREIVNIANQSGIQPSAITFPASTLGTTSSGAVSTNPTFKQSLLSQLTPVKGISGVYTLQIIIQQNQNSEVPYTRFIDFLQRLEQNRRTAQVTSIVLQPSLKNADNVSFTLTVDEYIKP